jgi:hypothetical protein
LTSEYLKQLQLTKQLEQKAKEATRNRKLAEDRLAEAAAELEAAKKMGTEVKAAETLLKDGQTLFGKREYLPAIAAADEVIQASKELRTTRVEEVLAAAQGVVAMIDDQGQDHRAIEKLVDSSRALLKEGRYPEALSEAKASGEAAERYADRRMEDMFSQLGRLIDLAEREKIAVASRKQTLAKAVKLHRDGDREGSLARAVSLFKGIQEAFAKLVEGRAVSILELAEGCAPGGDIAAVTALVERSREAVSRGRFEESLSLLEDAQKAVLPILAKAIEVLLQAQSERYRWLGERGVNVSKFESSAKKVTETYAAGQGEEAFEILRRSEKALRDSEVEVVLGYIERLRPRMILASRLKADLERVTSRLEEARQAAVYGRAKEAVEHVEEASAELDDALAPFRRLEAELDQTRRAFLQARRLRMVSTEASRLVAKAREDALAGRLGDSYDTLAKAKGVVVRIVQERCARQLFASQSMVAAGISIGADVDKDSEDLDELVEDLREGTIEGISTRLASINLALESALVTGTLAVIRQAGQAIESAPADVDVSPAVDLKRRAQEALASKDWNGSHALAREAQEMVEEARKVSLAARKARAHALLNICAQMGIESTTLQDKMAKADGDRGPLSGHLADDVVLYATALARDDVGRSISQLARGSAGARKNGVATAQVDRLIDEASHALADDDLERAFTAYTGARKELEKTTALHHEVYDLIVMLSRLSGELGLPPESPVVQHLRETKRLFEAGLYDGARTSARNCYKQAEVIGSPLLAPRALHDAQELIPVLRHLGVNVDVVQQALDGASEMLRKGDAAQALTTAKEERRKAVDTVTELIRSEIHQTRELLDREGGKPGDSHIRDVADKAEGLLADQRYFDAVRAARFARSEAAQFIAASTAATKELAAAEEGIQEIEELGVEVRESRDVLEQARKHRGGGRCNLVSELARRSLRSALTAAQEGTRGEVARAEREFKVHELGGRDLERVSKVKASLMADLDKHRFTQARKLLDIYREGLADIYEVRSQCAVSLSKLTEVLQGLPSSPSKVEADDLMVRAHHAFSDGSFHEALTLTDECWAAAAAARSGHERSARTLEEAHARLLGKDDRNMVKGVVTLVEGADRALREGAYERMHLDLLRAERLYAMSRERNADLLVQKLVNAARLASATGMSLAELPAGARDLLDVRLADLGRTKRLEDVVASVEVSVGKGIEDRAAAVKAKLKGQDLPAVRSLLSAAEAALANDRPDAALAMVKEAELVAGSSPSDLPELRNLRRRYDEAENIAAGLGLGGAGLEEYRKSLTCKNVKKAVWHLERALRVVEETTSGYLPVLVLRATRIHNLGRAPAIDLSLERGSPEPEDALAEVLWPEASAKMPPKGIGMDRVRVRYRALFVPRPLVKDMVRESR